jgi:ribosome-associated heat shock protein Hsp15
MTAAEGEAGRNRAGPGGGPADAMRLDKWLWQARFFKSRSLAAALCNAGRLRVSGTVVRKAHYAIRVGDVLTFPLGPHIRVVRILALGERRGPASEARTLYEDLAPPGTA